MLTLQLGHDRDQDKDHADRDACIRDVEDREIEKREEVGNVTVKQPVNQVAHRAAELEGDGSPQETV